MRARIILLLLFTCLFPAFSFAAIFTVTSNADNGPGTLREALTLAAANGSAEKDYINFNLPDLSEAGRTIRLSTKLPKMTSNLVIDGTTQPGAKFGISDAKVKIEFKFVYPDQLSVLSSDGADFLEIYGLWINCDSSGWGGAGIGINNFVKVIIGSPNKGNIINGANVGIHTGKICIYQNNNSGTDITGEMPGGGHVGISCEDATVGGSAATGNIFFEADLFFESQSTSRLVLTHNKFGTNYNGTKRIPINSYSQITRLVIEGTYYQSTAVPVNAVINNNIFVDEYNGILLHVDNLDGQITIQGNSFNTDPTGTINYLAGIGSTSMNDIVLSGKANFLVGGDSPAQRNLIAYSSLGIGYDPYGRYTFKHNSIFCVGENTFAGFVDNDRLPAVKITNVSGTAVKGTATPNSEVELFNADCNCSIPTPKDYVTTVRADANGKWFFNGVINGYVMASATKSNLTGLFTGLNIDDSNISITNASCTGKGSIRGIKTPFSSGYRWYNQQGTLVASTPDLMNADAGTYTLRVGIGTACDLTKTYVINDVVAKVDISKVNVIHATCNTPGAIKGVTVTPGAGPFYTRWLNKNNQQVCDCVDLLNVQAGNYTFEVGNLDGTCVQLFGPFTVKKTNAPTIDITDKIIKSSKCSETAGDIKNVKVIGSTGTIKFSWKNEQQQEVSTSADLTNQPPGRYVLTITDDSQCGPVSTPPIVIPAISDISINTNNKVVQNATCNNADGSITGIEVAGSGTLTYTWTNQFGQTAGTTKQLPAAVAGTYTLTVTAGNCLPVVSQPIEIFSIGGVTLNTHNISGQAATSCAPGFIKGITSPNATSVSWKRLADGAIASTTFDLLNAVSGQYELTVSNATCSRTWPFTIDQLPATVFPDFPATSTKSCFSFGTGSISINTDNAASLPSEYIWRNERGERVGYDKKVEFLPAGKYKLYLRDITGCESFYKEYTVDTYPEFKVGFGSYDNIYCGVGKGKINAATVTGGTGNYVYEWFDGDGNLLSGQTQPSLNNLEPGNYKLRITDGGCGLAELTYPIIATTQDINAPVADDLKLCGSGTAVISVKNPYPTALYRLYDSPASALAISEQIGGKFNVTVTESRSYFISLVYGNCESDRTEVKVVIGSIAGTIPNTFTPNGDGVNDYWALKGFENYPNGTVRIFNRAGQMVFQSTGYPKPFDGTWRGTALPAGSYYYIIDLKSCNMISGSVTLIR